MIGKNVRIDMLKGMDEQVGKRRNESWQNLNKILFIFHVQVWTKFSIG
jgi:hypothetical protein